MPKKANMYGNQFWWIKMNDFVADENAGINAILHNRLIDVLIFEHDVTEQYNKYAEELDLKPIKSIPDWDTEFILPDEYKEIDVEKFLLDKTHSLEEQKRVKEELKIFNAKNLYDALRLMIYIVDIMRKNKIVWGVGRGSSVASYCLYLIGVHKVNSLRYNLDITEFLK